MKKIISIMFGLGLVALFNLPISADGLEIYGVSCSTYPVTEASTFSSDISGTARVHRILISNSLASQVQTVSFYENGTSTTAVTAAFTVDIASGTQGNQFIDLPFDIHADYWKAEDMVIRKSATGSNIRVTVWYR